MALFNRKNKDKSKKEPKEVVKKTDEQAMAGEVSESDSVTTEETTGAGSSAFSGTIGSDAHKILKNFYVSEKASLATNFNQYVFKVFPSAKKNEVKKEVSKLFNVKVKDVKILNMPEKRRDFGKHPGTKIGFKKAIVVLEKGYSIGQAKIGRASCRERVYVLV